MSPRLSELKRHAPSPGTCTRVPVKTSAVRGAAAAVFWFVSREFGGVRDLTAPVVVGVPAVLRLIFSVVRTARGDVAVLSGSAACGAAVAVASVLHYGFPGDPRPAATNDELEHRGFIEHNCDWITGLVGRQAGPDTTDLWGS